MTLLGGTHRYTMFEYGVGVGVGLGLGLVVCSAGWRHKFSAGWRHKFSAGWRHKFSAGISGGHIWAFQRGPVTL